MFDFLRSQFWKILVHSKNAARANWRVRNRLPWAILVLRAPENLSKGALSTQFPIRLIEAVTAC
ncbi:MAG: hypothetical protein AAF354_14675 [Pseudomonadota bacterium]